MHSDAAVHSPCFLTDLHSLEGLSPVVKLLTEDAPALQAAAAYVLGTAASNNNKFQELLMQHHPESINLLMQVGNIMLALPG